jgi:hypothetical protein
MGMVQREIYFMMSMSMSMSMSTSTFLTPDEAQWVYDQLGEGDAFEERKESVRDPYRFPATEEEILPAVEKLFQRTFGESEVPFRVHRLVPVSREASRLEYVLEVTSTQAEPVATGWMPPLRFGFALSVQPEKSIFLQLRFMIGYHPMIYEYTFSPEVSVRRKLKGIVCYLVFLKTILYTLNLYEALRISLAGRMGVELQLPPRIDPRETIDQPWFFVFHRVEGEKVARLHMVRHLRKDGIYMEGGAGAGPWRLHEKTTFSEKFLAVYLYASTDL